MDYPPANGCFCEGSHMDWDSSKDLGGFWKIFEHHLLFSYFDLEVISNFLKR